MQPASTQPAAPKKSNKLARGLLYTAFALAVGGHFYSDYRHSQERAALKELVLLQDTLIETQGKMIDAQRLEIEVLKEEGGSSSGYCDDGFVIPDLKQRGPIQAKATKPSRATPAKMI